MPSRIHVAVSQFSPRKEGTIRANLGRLGRLFAQVDAMAPRPTVLVLPEAALTGYFLEGGVREQARTAGTLAQDLDDTYRQARLGAARARRQSSGSTSCGATRSTTAPLYVTLGSGATQIRHVHRKIFLPTVRLVRRRAVRRGAGPRDPSI